MKPRKKKLLNPDTIVLLKQVGIGFLVFTVVGLLVTIVWYGTRIESLTISKVSARGGETISHTGVEGVAEVVLDGHYVGLIPRRFSWFYPKSEIVEAVEKFERIHNVSVSRMGGTGLSIVYDEYSPFALWCSPSSDTECLFVDSLGYAFGHAPTLSGGSFLRFVTLGQEAVVGEVVLELEIFENLFLVNRLLADNGWFINRIEVDAVGDAFLKISGGGELKVIADESAEQIVENLMVVLSSNDFSHLKPGNFQYIDLRFGNKVFVNEVEVKVEEEMVLEDVAEVETEIQ